MNHAFPLAFFCWIHCDPEEPFPGATDLLRSLISQILLSSNGQIDMDFLTEANLHVVQNLDIQVLWTVFEKLLDRLVSGVFFCMIDGINFLEREVHIRGMCPVMQWLGMLAKDIQARNNGLVFKLMVTSPVTSGYCRIGFPGAIEMALSGNFLSDDQVFNQLRMASFAERAIFPGYGFT
ncbi:hypothetical protein CSAL01_01716 [Colletotrichum salicis]|uniref:Uncharacterized protein n=1 Tax=Colletotrichum salicis TaxID=1209931 RepID=A0A135V9C4_9PEZI|nr:hypothetical protein CSAL01_01716 [Colletotrichum salicis]